MGRGGAERQGAKMRNGITKITEETKWKREGKRAGEQSRR